MSLQTISVEMLKPNPYQPRQAVTPASVAELAEDIKAHGLIQPPIARPVNGHYQLSVGHRRVAAWRIAHPGTPITVDVRDLSDREMAEQAAGENAHRADLNPIERALGIKRLIDEFGLTQLEAGKLYNLHSQGAVSNALRLLGLPASVQKRLAEGAIPEHVARSLIPLCKLGEGKVSAIVERAAKKPDVDERNDFLESEISNLLHHDAISLHDAPWKLDTWPPEPIKLSSPVDGIAELPSCKGCPFAIGRGNYPHCVRPKCFELKLDRFANDEAARLSESKGIALAAGGEKVSVIFDGKSYSSDDRDETRKLIAGAKHVPGLRFIPYTENHGRYGLREVVGSEAVALGTVDRTAANAFLASSNGGKKQTAAEVKTLTPAQLKKQRAAEEAEKAARRAERAALLKAEQDVSWLVINAAKLIGERINVSGGVAAMLSEQIKFQIFAFELLSKFDEQLVDLSDAAKEKEREKHLRTQIAFRLICGEVANTDSKGKPKYDWDHIEDRIAAMAATGKKWPHNRTGFDVQLPAGWNKPPVHKTDYNCWHCGTFASSPKLTQRDQGEGWTLVSEGGKAGATIIDVVCPDCAEKYQPASQAPKKGKGK